MNSGKKKMKTNFAPPERASKEQISTDIHFVSTNPVMSGLLDSISGLLAILDENRQIIAMNESFLRFLGVVTRNCY